MSARLWRGPGSAASTGPFGGVAMLLPSFRGRPVSWTAGRPSPSFLQSRRTLRDRGARDLSLVLDRALSPARSSCGGTSRSAPPLKANPPSQDEQAGLLAAASKSSARIRRTLRVEPTDDLSVEQIRLGAVRPPRDPRCEPLRRRDARDRVRRRRKSPPGSRR